MAEFEDKVRAMLERALPEFQSLVKVERLSGGASQETYQVEIRTGNGTQLLAMRRAPGGVKVEPVAGHPGLDVEALLMSSARDAGVPEPEVFHVFDDEDDLGDGFLMQWLEGIALGARVLRSPELDEIRPQLAYMCGEALARIHDIDLVATGLDQKLSLIEPGQ